MDRPLDHAVIRTRSRRRWLTAGSLAGFALALVGWGPSLLGPAVDRGRIRTAVVDAGPLEAATSAAGRVLPEVEQVLTTATSRSRGCPAARRGSRSCCWRRPDRLASGERTGGKVDVTEITP